MQDQADSVIGPPAFPLSLHHLAVSWSSGRALNYHGLVRHLVGQGMPVWARPVGDSQGGTIGRSKNHVFKKNSSDKILLVE
eukprot:s900_g10.t1